MYFAQGAIGVPVSECSCAAIAPLHNSGLMLFISCPDWIAGDTVLHQREDRDYVCVYAVCMRVAVRLCAAGQNAR